MEFLLIGGIAGGALLAVYLLFQNAILAAKPQVVKLNTTKTPAQVVGSSLASYSAILGLGLILLSVALYALDLAYPADALKAGLAGGLLLLLGLVAS